MKASSGPPDAPGPRSAPPGASDPPPSSRSFGGPLLARDTEACAFTPILEMLVERVSGAYAATLVDPQGETVDYTGRGDPFDLRIASAEVQLVLQGIARSGALGEPRWLVLRASRRAVAATALPDGYALGLMLRSRSAFAISTRALRACMRALAAEAGWSAPESGEGVTRPWFPVKVQSDFRGRPARVVGLPRRADSKPLEVEVLGTLMGLSVRERGFRVRTSDGRELTLVREPRQRWYADDDV